MAASEARAFIVWDVVKVPFPYANRPIFQRRPALLVGQHWEPGSPHLLWLLMITSAAHRRWSGDVEIADLQAAGLPAASIVRCAKIATVEPAEVETIGRLAGVLRDAVRAHVGQVLAALLRG